MELKFNDELKRRTWQRKDPATGEVIASGEYPEWHGRWRDADGKWKWRKLYRDKKSSRRAWQEFQTRTERRASGVTTADSERLNLPIQELAAQYIESMRVQKKDSEHIRISEWMLNRLIELGGWKKFADISRDGMEKAIAKLAADGMTASYQNKFIIRAKAFVNALLPEGWPHPLRKLTRVREKGGKRTRERRAATFGQLSALFAVDAAADRALPYALAAYNGLRRNEVNRLTWGDLKLDAPIPFIGVRRKQGQDDTLDYVPIHPYVLTILQQRTPGLPATRLTTAPDVKTLQRDWQRAGVAFKDEKGRRLDFHALRHSFQTALDRTGCSRATKKRLMRHAAQDVTDGYAHAELDELREALNRLPSPSPDPGEVATGAATGTDGKPAAQVTRRSYTGHSRLCHTMQADAAVNPPEGCQVAQPPYNPDVVGNEQALALTGANSFPDNDLRPSTQVD